ncbi:MAG TPA: TonB-dependent receptor [Verrucomicrobiae bacterium]|nr:TonB-dependent receptor [Verrucomicrobiae bacterium]
MNSSPSPIRSIIGLWLLLALTGAPASAQDAPSTAEPATPAATEPATEPATETESSTEPAPAGDTGSAPSQLPDAAEAPAEVVPTVPVAAAEEPLPTDATQLDTMQVTGSRLRRSDYETAQPVVVISREDIERSGLTDITEILRNMTVAGNNSLSPQQGRFALSMGETNIDLRNLGATHTLLLVNGRRWVTGLIPTQTSVSDFNTIPTAIIERIEVLKDGASAIYGSDAIAGVVNVITRKDFEGASIGYHVGQYFEFGDGLNPQLALNWGRSRPGSSAFVNLSYTRQDEYSNQNHELTARPIVGPTRDSIVTPDGLFQFISRSDVASRYQCPNLQAGIAAGAAGEPTTGGPIRQTQIIPAGLVLCQLKLDTGAVGGNTLADGDDFHQIDRNVPEDVYNRFADGTLKEPNQRSAMYGTLDQEIFDGITLNLETLYNRRESTSVGQNGGLSGGNLDGFKGYLAGIPASQNPFGHDIGIDSSCGGDPTSPSCTGLGVGSGNWNIRRLDVESNNQEFRDTVDTFRLGGGLRGSLPLLDRDWSWDTGYIYSRSKIEELLTSVNYEKAGRALDPNCSGDCVPLNLFNGARGLTDAAVNFIRSTTYQRNGTTQDIAYVNFATELPMWDLLAGPVGLGFGFEFRKDTYSSDIDPIIKQGLIRLNTLENTAGAQYSREAYAELGLPLLEDLPLAHSLELSLAARYSTFPRIDPVTTGKAGLRWQPLEDLLLRGSYSTGFRAPSVGELFLGSSQSFDGIVDPCAAPGDNDNADTNCASDGTPGGGSGGAVLTPYDLWQGNPDLKPESSKNLTYGFIYSPEWLQDFNIGVDYYKIEIEDFVTIGQGQYFLDSCYKASTVAAERNYCEYIERSDAGDLLYVNTPYFNLNKVVTSGYDIGLDYILPLPIDFGRFRFNLDTTYLQEYTFRSPQPGQADQVDGLVGQAGGQFQGYPRWKGGGYLNWQYERVRANWSTRMAYHLTEPCGDLFPAPSLADLGLCNRVTPAVDDDPLTDADESRDAVLENKLDTIFYHNVSVGYDLTDLNADFTVGINNVLDQDPQVSRSLSSLFFYNFDPNHYEVPGRLGYIKINYKF